MTSFTDLDSANHRDGNEELFGRISNELLDTGYSVNIDALPIALANQLYLNVSAMKAGSFEEAAIGRDQDHMRNVFVRSQRLSWIAIDSEPNSGWLRWANSLGAYLNRHLFLGLSSFESHHAHFSAGDFYKRHYDAFKGQEGRKVSVIVYLNRDWMPNDGGELVLYTNDEDKVGLKITPSFATVVVLLSEECPHEVLPVYRDRYSISGWYGMNTTYESTI